MNVSITDHFKVRDAAELYGLDGWGGGYFSIGQNGLLQVRPHAGGPGIDVLPIVEELVRRGYRTPLILRFPQLLGAQVDRLAKAFHSAIREFDYSGAYYPLFPIKVNQQRTVVEGLLDGGARHGLGLEVGSRPELMLATALQMPADATIVCNGFKDRPYLESACLAVRLGRRVTVVVEKPFELDSVLEIAGQEHVPEIGFRLRLQAKGSGLWERSGGFASKFGLTTQQMLDALERLDRAGLRDKVSLLHFHIGSQITDIRKIKVAVREASRIYAKMRKLGVGIRTLDVGGGLGIDYDGSRTSSDASVNYGVQEYANDVVFGIQEVCDQEEVEAPTILTESGRMMTAYHAMLITDVRCAISGFESEPPAVVDRDAQVVQDLAETLRTITVKNYREFYHDAIEYRDQMESLFNLGMLGLEEKAKAERLFWSIAARAVTYSKTAKFMADEFVQLESKLHDKYVCNFSVFQSLPDHWALDQLFPVMPIHRLDEPPTRRASLVDITCDSDGEVEKFVDRREIKSTLEVHDLKPGEPYFLGFLLIGAYQDTMGDLHNLFGRAHQAEVILDESGSASIHRVWPGEPAGDVLRWFGYDAEVLSARVEAGLAQRCREGEIEDEDASRLLDLYRQQMRRYTYLD